MVIVSDEKKETGRFPVKMLLLSSSDCCVCGGSADKLTNFPNEHLHYTWRTVVTYGM